LSDPREIVDSRGPKLLRPGVISRLFSSRCKEKERDGENDINGTKGVFSG